MKYQINISLFLFLRFKTAPEVYNLRGLNNSLKYIQNTTNETRDIRTVSKLRLSVHFTDEQSFTFFSRKVERTFGFIFVQIKNLDALKCTYELNYC